VIARRGQCALLRAATCGSVWACPVCSARIQAERADELLDAVETTQARGQKVVLLLRIDSPLQLKDPRGRQRLPQQSVAFDPQAGAEFGLVERVLVSLNVGV
jgi:hypothetical protein